jgi:hypothetical protein
VAELRSTIADVDRLLRPDSALTHCDIHVMRALRAAETEARCTGSALVQPRHLFVALVAYLTQQNADCPADLDQVRETFRPMRTISVDESPAHLPLARTLRAILVSAPSRWGQRIRPEMLADDLLRGDDDAAFRIVLSLRHPRDTEAAVRAWLEARIARYRSGDIAEELSDIFELALVLLRDLDRPTEAEDVLLDALPDESARPDLLGDIAQHLEQAGDLDAAELVYRLAARLERDGSVGAPTTARDDADPA